MPASVWKHSCQPPTEPLVLTSREPASSRIDAPAGVQPSPRAPQRRLIVWALGDIETDESVAILAQVAKADPSRETRRLAVQVLGAMGTPASKKALRGLLQDN